MSETTSIWFEARASDIFKGAQVEVIQSNESIFSVISDAMPLYTVRY